MMIILKSHPLFTLINGYLIDLPEYSNINHILDFLDSIVYFLLIEIITVISLAIVYNVSLLEAFISLMHVIGDVNNE
uniref:Cytb-like ORF n=1 Tax=Pseudocercospora fijiensis TaxID=1873960 RepID=A0A516EZP8_9PEZI|nr:cytb-like ORF [Pseudocercospora fijiensis]QDO71972.1 cytb-like ORF [Pseudocercospora fijiensis]